MRDVEERLDVAACRRNREVIPTGVFHRSGANLTAYRAGEMHPLDRGVSIG
jgi:hypothetical protein